MKLKLTLEEFKDALNLLDKKLIEADKSLTIKAIGGFALLWREVRSSGYTADIDSVTSDFTPDIIALIESVSEELSIPKDWINNYNVIDNDTEAVEIMLEPFWEEAHLGLKNIKLWVADLETLIRAKLIAVEDSDLTGRLQDLPDLVALLKKVGCTCTKGALSYFSTEMYIEAKIEYPLAVKQLETVSWDGTDSPVSSIEQSYVIG